MTAPSAPVRLVALTAVLTAALMVAILAVQHTRGGWPFEASTAGAIGTRGTAGTEVPGTPDRVPVAVDTGTMQQLGIRLEPVRQETVTQSIRAVATVVPDESRLSHIHTRVAGWIEQLEVTTTGEFIRAGQPLARIFSQELLSSQTEYLAARRIATSGLSTAVVASGRTRLGVLGMTEAEIAAIEHSGEPMRLVTVVAPRSGIVVHRGISLGTAVDPSTELLTIADLSRVWILAEVPEADIPHVRVGTAARLEFPASALPPFSGRVDFIFPTLSERTRTLRVRLAAPNARGALRPGLYGAATFEIPGRTAMTVPRDAVVDTGLQQHVFVPVGDQFQPRPVSIGTRLADRVEILEGLAPGDQIVAAGVFLLDSESRLRATGGNIGHDHGGDTPSEAPPAVPAAAPAPNRHAGH
jgi:membrane fusion protein, copper/silver efflux system